MIPVIIIACFVLLAEIGHFISYHLEKKRILKKQNWDLNICCGRTDGGGVNADIFKHKDLPNFILLDDIYKLPFSKNEFQNTLCSHTMEHVESPDKFFEELQRVSEIVTLVIPPLWDLFALLNVFEHKVIFLTLKKEHNSLPKYIKLPGAEIIQKRLGQANRA